MNYSVFIRPLEITDAKTSYKWRNNSSVWEFTEFKPTKRITAAIETAWIKKALAVKNDYRFAICVKKTGQYIGNVQLINVEEGKGEFHIVIGDVNFWGQGIGQQAAELILYFGFNFLNLDRITLEVHKLHVVAQRLYQKLGFQSFGNRDNFIKMVVTEEKYRVLLNVSLTKRQVATNLDALDTVWQIS